MYALRRKNFLSKKVLLLDSKRLTTRGVTALAHLSPVLPLSWGGGLWVLLWTVPVMGLGHTQRPPPGKDQGPESRVLTWKGPGTRDQGKELGPETRGYPPFSCEQTHTCKNNTFPILRMQAVQQ